VKVHVPPTLLIMLVVPSSLLKRLNFIKFKKVLVTYPDNVLLGLVGVDLYTVITYACRSCQMRYLLWRTWIRTCQCRRLKFTPNLKRSNRIKIDVASNYLTWYGIVVSNFKKQTWYLVGH